MKANAGLIIVAVGFFLLYVAVSDKYPVLARFMREMFDIGAGEGETVGAAMGRDAGAAVGAAVSGGGVTLVQPSSETPFDMLQRMGIRVTTPPFVQQVS
jgi:hypothetical protein